MTTDYDVGRVPDGTDEKGGVPTPLELERRAHEAFAASRRRAYVEVPSYLERLDEHVVGDGPPLIVTGDSGAGKSSLLAYWSERYRLENPDAFIITYYIGATSFGTDHLSILRRIMVEIRERYNLADEIPTSAAQIEQELPFWLARVQQEKLVLVIDALNQLDNYQLSTRWLSDYIQPRVRLILSLLDGPIADGLRERGWPELRVMPLTLQERRAVVKQLMGAHAMRFSSEQLRRISGHSTSSNPLFLRTRLEELRRYGSYEKLNERIDHYLAAKNLDDLFQRVLERLEGDYGPDLVRSVLRLIWASRRGLSEGELQDLTGARREGLSQLLEALEYHLMRRDGLLTFFHDHLRQSVRQRYLTGRGNSAEKVHLRIAKYFGSQPISPRRADEQPWQLQRASTWPKLKECITDISMFMALSNEESKYQLLGYWLSLGDRWNMGEEYAREVKEYRRVEEEPLNIGEVLDRLGAFLIASGRYEGAELVLRQALFIRRRSLGLEHAATIETMENLASLYYYKRNMDRAEPFARKAMEVREKQFGIESPLTLASMNTLGAMLYLKEEYDEAEALFLRLIAINERVHGANSQATTQALNNLGTIYKAKERLDDAVLLFERALAINEKAFGAEHPKVATNLGNLGVVLKMAGKNDLAEVCYRRALAINRKMLGADHPETGKALINIGSLLRAQNDFDAAEIMFREGLAISEKVYGPEHLNVINMQHNLAELLAAKGDYERAKPLYLRIAMIKAKILGVNNPESIRATSRYLDLLCRMNVSKEMVEAEKKLLNQVV
ncbi:MAG: tetratricopeptide repeat domain containing protein [Chlorobi bacterium]|nr:tetratricopeptide repeat domain containing protein [Chlorobiota bacterium]